MPTLDTFSSDKPIKLLAIGRSGSGKTGALSSLADAGYRLIIADFDNGLDALVNFAKPASLKNVHYQTFTDSIKGSGGMIVPKGACTAFPGFLRNLDKWRVKDPDGEGYTEDLGSIYDWGPNDIFVIDSFTHLGNAAMRLAVSLGGRSGKQPQIQDWGEAMRQSEEVLAMLYDDSIKCNVIVNTHITYVDEVEGISGYPSALGNKLPPKVGSYFNTTLLFRSKGSGANARREITTTPEGLIEAKFPGPNPPKDLPLSTGLATIFKQIRGVTP